MIISYCSVAGQDVIFVNDSINAPVLNDSVIRRDQEISSFYAGHHFRTNHNTIFFNGRILLTKVAINSFVADWVFFQNFIANKTTFKKRVLIDSTGCDTLFFQNCSFNNGILIKNGQIEDLRFVESKISGRANFVSMVFTKASFANTVFNSPPSFDNCTFKDASFNNTHFQNGALFNKCIFDGTINFDSCTLPLKLALPFSSLTNNSNFSFIGTNLPDTIDLSGNISLGNIIDFTKADYGYKEHLGKKISIYLYKTDLSKIQLDYQYFKLIFRASPDSVDISADEKEKLYEGLLNNFKTRGYLESYRLLDIEYQRFKAKNSTLGFLWWIPEYWWNYGYNKEWIFYWVIGFMLAFTFINFFAYNWIVPIYKPDHLPVWIQEYSWGRFWYSFVYTGMIFFSFSLKIDKIKVKNKGGTLYLVLLYSVGLICIAYMANFVIQK